MEKSLAKNLRLARFGCADGMSVDMMRSASGGILLTACGFGLQISHYGYNCGLQLRVRCRIVSSYLSENCKRAHGDRQDPIRRSRFVIAGYRCLSCSLSGLTRTVEFGLLSIIYSILSILLAAGASWAHARRGVSAAFLFILYSLFSFSRRRYITYAFPSAFAAPASRNRFSTSHAVSPGSGMYTRSRFFFSFTGAFPVTAET